jgi:hypothetical protein
MVQIVLVVDGSCQFLAVIESESMGRKQSEDCIMERTKFIDNCSKDKQNLCVSIEPLKTC